MAYQTECAKILCHRIDPDSAVARFVDNTLADELILHQGRSDIQYVLESLFIRLHAHLSGEGWYLSNKNEVRSKTQSESEDCPFLLWDCTIAAHAIMMYVENIITPNIGDEFEIVIGDSNPCGVVNRIIFEAAIRASSGVLSEEDRQSVIQLCRRSLLDNNGSEDPQQRMTNTLIQFIEKQNHIGPELLCQAQAQLLPILIKHIGGLGCEIFKDLWVNNPRMVVLRRALRLSGEKLESGIADTGLIHLLMSGLNLTLEDPVMADMFVEFNCQQIKAELEYCQFQNHHNDSFTETKDPDKKDPGNTGLFII